MNKLSGSILVFVCGTALGIGLMAYFARKPAVIVHEKLVLDNSGTNHSQREHAAGAVASPSVQLQANSNRMGAGSEPRVQPQQDVNIAITSSSQEAAVVGSPVTIYNVNNGGVVGSNQNQGVQSLVALAPTLRLSPQCTLNNVDTAALRYTLKNTLSAADSSRKQAGFTLNSDYWGGWLAPGAKKSVQVNLAKDTAYWFWVGVNTPGKLSVGVYNSGGILVASGTSNEKRAVPVNYVAPESGVYQVSIEDDLLTPGSDAISWSLISFSNPAFVTVGKGVRTPGRVPFSKGLTLSSAINACGGLGDVSDPRRVRLTRDKVVQVVDIRKIWVNSSSDIPLLPFDIVEVPQTLW
jgi:hypothetical protein